MFMLLMIVSGNVRLFAQTPEIEIILFSDFQCPFCAKLSQPFRELQSEGVEGVRTSVQFRNFPLEMHADAALAHHAAMAAAKQGKFWEMHDLLFSHQSALKRDHLLNYAKTLQLHMDRFRADIESTDVNQAIQADIAEGTKRGINATPTFYINGRQYVGTRTLEQLKKLVRDERWRSEALSTITDDLLSQGPEDAPVRLEVFADLTSPVSIPALNIIQSFRRESTQPVRVQFRNFPLAFHPQAPLAHEAAMAAATQGQFWKFVDFILEHQDTIREQDLIAFASKVGLDPEQFSDSIQEHRYAPRVDADVELASQRGVRGSPVIFVNGKRIDGVPNLEILQAEIQPRTP
jgi:protein-disulfide isomerase